MATTAALWHGPRFPALDTPVYEVALAATLEEVRSCQRLRYQVFNEELGEGLDGSRELGLDRDSFDVICDHLLVREVLTGEVVGTYRMQTGYRARGNAGYYSEEFFEFGPFEGLRAQLLELGRACVDRHHRDSGVLNLLWKGIFRYALDSGARFLIGCSSLASQDPAEGAALYRTLAPRHLAPPALRTVPRPGHAVPESEPRAASAEVPRLLRAYLDLSAKICGPPAIDRAFKTIDFLTLLDLEGIPRALRRRLAGRGDPAL